MREGAGAEEADAEVVRRRLDAVLGRGPASAAASYGPLDPDDDLGDLDDGDDPDDGSGRPPRRRPGGRHTEDGDLAEGLGLWPQLVGALADRVPVAVRHGRWGVSGPVVAAVLVVAAVVVLVLAVRSSAGAPGVPVPVRATSATSAPAPGAAPAGAAPPGATPAAAASAAPGSGTGPVPGGEGAPGAPTASGPAPTSSDVPAPGTATAVAAPAGAGEVVVHVVGRVARAGVVRLPTGSRVADALDAAGGPAPDADLARVNLARPLVDGEQVVVPAPGEELATAPPPAAAPPPAEGAAVVAGGGAAAAGTGPVDLNTATEADLDALPGIGPVLAQRILEVRGQLGSFTSVEELGEVSGIGEARLAELRELVVVA